MSRRGEAVGDITEVAQDFRLLSIPLRPGPFLQEFVGNNNRRMSVFRSRSAPGCRCQYQVPPTPWPASAVEAAADNRRIESSGSLPGLGGNRMRVVTKRGGSE